MRHALTRATGATALVTAAAVLTGLIQAAPAAADTTPEEDTGYSRNSIGEARRLDRCLAGVALHVGGPRMKAKAVEGLAGTEAQLRETVGDTAWLAYGPLGVEARADKEAAGLYFDEVRNRVTALDEANKPYRESAWADEGMEWHAPAFGEDVIQFTYFTQTKLAWQLGWDGHSNASAEAVARARAVMDENQGKDAWNDFGANWMLRDSEVGNTEYSRGTTSSDIASYLRHGGFLTETPAKDSPAYRVEVEDLKQAWAACDSQNPVDPRRVLNDPTMTAMVEWEQEYAGQATQRATIIQAEADAAAATRAAADDMVRAIGLAWFADQITTWRAYWQAAAPDTIFEKPDQAFYDKATADLARTRADVAAAVTSAKAWAAKAAAASQRAATAQQEAWAVADTSHVPRGRGLTYAQQSVQVVRASAAAAEAAAKATETALSAANATAATGDALLAKAQTESHAINTEFRRVAAQEAAAQAKAAADSAEANATAAAESANTAKAARTTAEDKRDKAKTAAGTAATERAKAQAEQAAAVASRAKAAAERTKATEAEQRAAGQKTAAQSADTAAGSAAHRRRGPQRPDPAAGPRHAPRRCLRGRRRSRQCPGAPG
ncbi:hypothetical protein ACFCY7_38925, partial [Streptomyces sp. NPDC056361]